MHAPEIRQQFNTHYKSLSASYLPGVHSAISALAHVISSILKDVCYC